MPARILIVEDERITAEDLRDILTNLDYSVVASVSNGADAIALAEETQPDLALMDIQIKGAMDGTETARVLRERFNIPVVFLTAHADSGTVARAKSAAPLGYILKPFHEGELHACIAIPSHTHGVALNSLPNSELFTSPFPPISTPTLPPAPPQSLTSL